MEEKKLVLQQVQVKVKGHKEVCDWRGKVR
jgi:hypothetical protein